MPKTHRNSVFLSHESYILDWLYIMVLYISFYVFIFLNKLDQNPKVLSFGLLKNVSLCQKLIETLYLLVVNLVFLIGYT
jgi:hypothetical protein